MCYCWFINPVQQIYAHTACDLQTLQLPDVNTFMLGNTSVVHWDPLALIMTSKPGTLADYSAVVLN